MRERVDRQALHEYLFRQVNRNSVVRIRQNKLAAGLDINKWTMSKIIHELVDDGRIKRQRGSIDYYRIEDPAPWRS